MSTILNKKQMTEEDIKLQYITPAITAKWDAGHITMETKITDGKVNIKGNLVFREKPKKASTTEDKIALINKLKNIRFKDNRTNISISILSKIYTAEAPQQE